MKTLTLDVRDPADAMADFSEAWNTGTPQKTARISFSSPEVRALIILQRIGLLSLLFPFAGITLQVPEIHGTVQIVTDKLISRLHKKGVPIQVWTINEEADMYRLLEMGVDGIVTEDPRLLMQVLHSRRSKPHHTAEKQL